MTDTEFFMALNRQAYHREFWAQVAIVAILQAWFDDSRLSHLIGSSLSASTLEIGGWQLG